MKRIAFLGLLLLLFATNGMAANLICKIQPGADINQIAKIINATVVGSIPEENLYFLTADKIPNNTPPGAEYLEADVPASIPRQAFSILSKTVTSDTALWYQDQQAMKLVNLQAALKLSKGSHIVIADINSVVDFRHPALIGHLIAGYDFVATNGNRSGSASQNDSSASYLDQSSASYLDESSASYLDQSSASYLDQSSASYLDQSSASYLDQSSASYLDTNNPAHGHGTIVAGILAAMAPDAMIMPLRTFDDKGYSSASQIAKAIRYAVKNGANVINLSLGLTGPSKTVEKAIDQAVKQGVVVVTSAGNNNNDAPQYPAAYSTTVSVAATNNQDIKANFSNYGRTISVSAPGVNIISAYPGGYYAMASGTSFSAPMVAAEAALLLSLNNTVGNSITTGVVDIDKLNPAYKGLLGKGRIELLKAEGGK